MKHLSRLTVIIASYAVFSFTSMQYGYASECEDATDTAESAASDLADYSRKLQQCAESEDYSDDCDYEFRRVKSAFDDYESSVSDVSNYCE
ncbi:MAG: hypothetical protein WA173_17670 [Pseudomonas sp.]|uniref:hypothetical protein n=1 Tax=Pseudomonas sp. TaxID=306 RepID=UPI003BB647C5